MPYTPEAYQLMQDGAVALAKVESTGIRIDTDYIINTIEETQRKIKRKSKKISESRLYRRWRQRFKIKTNFGSNEQLGKILFDELGHKSHAQTTTGRYKTDEDALAMVDDPDVRDWLMIKKLQNAVARLREVERETCNGFLHANYNLHIARTFRSSSSEPNFQNFPIRIEWLKKLIRQAFRARKGRRLVELDYGQIEVRGSYCYHKDPVMKRYLLDPKTDMHRDMAMECFLLAQEEVTKPIRHAAKNQFVFPEFYGAWWMDCAAGLWNMIDTSKLITTSGIPLRDHLKKKGIKRLGDQNREDSHPKPGTFEAHIQKVEKFFWEKRFRVYSQWKKDWYNQYLKNGFLKMLTGFICQGFMSRNDVINYPVQGASFHCLLWAMTRLVNVELRKARMKSRVVGQIHDSILSDVPEDELDDYIALAKDVMINKLREHWDWIIIPLEIEAEVTPVEGCWVEKEEYKL